MAELPPTLQTPPQAGLMPPGMPPPTGLAPTQQTDLEILQTPNDLLPLWETEEGRMLYQVCKDYDMLDDFARKKQVRVWRKHLNYWNNIQYGSWDETAGDWKSPQDILDEDPQADIDPAIYAKVINVYKAHGEILIGALTQGTPTVRFFPKDAD